MVSGSIRLKRRWLLKKTSETRIEKLAIFFIVGRFSGTFIAFRRLFLSSLYVSRCNEAGWMTVRVRRVDG